VDGLKKAYESLFLVVDIRSGPGQLEEPGAIAMWNHRGQKTSLGFGHLIMGDFVLLAA
jgi:hypothetical protein